MKTKNCKKLWGTLTAICMLTAIERVNAEHNNATATQDASSSGSNPLARVERAANLYGKQLLSADNQKVGK
ncbi:MAG TPA: hypothetical protein VEC99_12055, partial [Clostridia bacterium]|nr:hypothetical protein [Clostridia bacterium]